MYAFESIIGLLLCIVILSYDIFCVIFICQLHSELDLIEYSIKNLTVKSKASLINVIKRHVTVMDYGIMICNHISTILFFQHTIGAIFISVVGVITINVNISHINIQNFWINFH